MTEVFLVTRPLDTAHHGLEQRQRLPPIRVSWPYRDEKCFGRRYFSPCFGNLSRPFSLESNLVNRIYQLLFSCALVYLTPCVAQESVALSELKKAIGRESIAIHLNKGEDFADRLYKVDAKAQVLTFGSRHRPRVVSCAEIKTLEFEPKAVRRKRLKVYGMVSNGMIPVAIVLLASGTGGAAVPLLLWPGGYAWGWPLSKSIVKRETKAFQVSCQ